MTHMTKSHCKFFMITLLLLATTSVFAFGGGGGGRKSTTYDTGASKIGFHIREDGHFNLVTCDSLGDLDQYNAVIAMLAII